MTREEHWNTAYERYMQFLKENRQRPSKHRIEEHQLLNWYKWNKRRYLHNEMRPERRGPFQELMGQAEALLRVNQHAYKREKTAQLTLNI